MEKPRRLIGFLEVIDFLGAAIRRKLKCEREREREREREHNRNKRHRKEEKDNMQCMNMLRAKEIA